MQLENYPYRLPPMDHQMKVLEASWDKDEYGYFMEMGTGKSKVAIDNTALLYDEGRIDALLVLAPKGVYRNWSSIELPKHLPEHIEHRIGVWSPNHTKKKKAELMKLFDTDTEDLMILVMNIEALSTAKGVKFVSSFVKRHRCMAVVDESTKIKNPKAARTKAALRLAIHTKFRRILSGTPVTQSPLDIYTQAQFLNACLLGYSSYYSFRARYADMIDRSAGGRTFKQVTGYKNLEELAAIVEKFSYRVLKKDCLDLPEKVYQRREVEMTKEQKQFYAEMKKFALVDMDDGETVSATIVLTQIMKLHQVACGFVKTDDGNIIDIPNNRLPELMECIEEINGKVIIWAHYVHNINQIVSLLNETYGAGSAKGYFGDTEDDEREAIVKEFQDPDSDLRFFVANRTGAYGLTLTEATYSIYYSNDYDLDVRLQSEDRNHRIGQDDKVTYIDLVALGTVDEKIVESLRNKLNIASQVLGEELKKWI